MEFADQVASSLNSTKIDFIMSKLLSGLIRYEKERDCYSKLFLCETSPSLKTIFWGFLDFFVVKINLPDYFVYNINRE